MATFYAPAGYGAPMSGDVAYFYDGDTTTPATVYQDVDRTVNLGTSVTADANGGWPNIFLDDEITYKVTLIRAGGSLAAPLKTTWPLNAPIVVAPGSITPDKMSVGAAVTNIGYTPVNQAGDTMAGELLLAATFTSRDPRAAGLTGAGANNTQNNTYTFALVDARKTTKKTDTSTPTWTIPPAASVAFAENDILIVENTGGTGNVTIARGAGVTLTTNGASTSADYTLTPYSTASLKNVGLNSWRVL